MRQGTWTTSLFWIRERQQLITKEAATEKNLHHPHPLPVVSTRLPFSKNKNKTSFFFLLLSFSYSVVCGVCVLVRQEENRYTNITCAHKEDEEKEEVNCISE